MTVFPLRVLLILPNFFYSSVRVREKLETAWRVSRDMSSSLKVEVRV